MDPIQELLAVLKPGSFSGVPALILLADRKLTDAQWLKLSDGTRAWYNAQVSQLNDQNYALNRKKAVSEICLEPEYQI
jgi:hypothetical protein